MALLTFACERTNSNSESHVPSGVFFLRLRLALFFLRASRTSILFMYPHGMERLRPMIFLVFRASGLKGGGAPILLLQVLPKQAKGSIRFEAQIAKYGSSKDRQPSGTTLGLWRPVYLPFSMIGNVRE